ncbi:MAG: MFS family permease [Psychroserpens sp.]|jgi:MFS family permease
MRAKKSNIPFVIKASLAAFGAYFCMYAFRKPFSVATFEGMEVFHIDYKIILIIAQVLGYALSKFIGIKVVSELKANQRVYYLLGLISIAELALVLFALVPKPFNVIFMFLNGVPLGMIWGIVFSYLEGRKFTEILGVALSTSFIVSSGVVKSVGLFVMTSWGFSQFWMPAITGSLFVLPLLFFAWLLEKIPKPTKEDIELRSERIPMTGKDRKKLLLKFAFPITIWILFYTFLTSFRDFRDNFSRELWDSIGYKGDISVYSSSETLVACIVLLVLGSAFYFKENMKALLFYQFLLLVGSISLGVSTYLFHNGIISPFTWMVVSGFGLYICYVPFNCLFFDRFIGAFRIKANAGFLIYLADAFGYLGSVAVLLYKNFGQSSLSWIEFFMSSAYAIAGIGFVVTISSILYLNGKFRMHKKSNINYKLVLDETYV